MLPLVFMDPFHLHIEQRGVIDQQPALLLDVVGQPQLGFAAHLLPALKEAPVVQERRQVLKPIKITAPAITDGLIQQCG